MRLCLELTRGWRNDPDAPVIPRTVSMASGVVCSNCHTAWGRLAPLVRAKQETAEVGTR